MNARLKALALGLFHGGAVRLEPTPIKHHETRPGAPLTPIYFNLRTQRNPKPGPLTPPLVKMIGQVLFDLVERKGLVYDHVVGIPHAGTPLAAAFKQAATASHKATSLLRMEKVEKGNQRQVGCLLDDPRRIHDSVLVIDDVISQGGSKVEAIQQIEKECLSVWDVVVLIDRQQGGMERLAQRDHTLHAVFQLTELLEFYRRERLITAEQESQVLDYLANQ